MAAPRSRAVRAFPAAARQRVFERLAAARGWTPFRQIESPDELRRQLQFAIELEHATLPPYMCALYSIQDGHNLEAAQIIKSVLMEEMLHLTLAANVLNAIGGAPEIGHETFTPEYPTYLPNSNNRFVVALRKFSPQAIDTFMRIEKPAAPGAPAEGHHYSTIGQFYDAIEHAIRTWCEVGNPFAKNDARRQVTPEHYYGGGGEVIPILGNTVKQCLPEIERAFAIVVEQGEGTHHGIWDPDSVFDQEPEVAHYFRFQEIYQGRCFRKGDTPQTGPTGAALAVDWDAVYNMRPDPKTAHYPEGSELWEMSRAFNRVYMELLATLHDALNGRPALIQKAVGKMYELKYRAVELMRTPCGVADMTAGPSFEYLRLR